MVLIILILIFSALILLPVSTISKLGIYFFLCMPMMSLASLSFIYFFSSFPLCKIRNTKTRENFRQLFSLHFWDGYPYIPRLENSCLWDQKWTQRKLNMRWRTINVREERSSDPIINKKYKEIIKLRKTRESTSSHIYTIFKSVLSESLNPCCPPSVSISVQRWPDLEYLIQFHAVI